MPCQSPTDCLNSPITEEGHGIHWSRIAREAGFFALTWRAMLVQQKWLQVPVPSGKTGCPKGNRGQGGGGGRLETSLWLAHIHSIPLGGLIIAIVSRIVVLEDLGPQLWDAQRRTRCQVRPGQGNVTSPSHTSLLPEELQ